MANPRGIRAGAAYVELFVSDSKLVRGLSRAAARLKAFGTAIAGWGEKLALAGAAVTSGLLLGGKSFATMGDQIAKMSRRTGLSVQSLSELAYAASLSGAGVETLETGIRRMQRSIVDAAEGSQMAVDAFKLLGLEAADFAGLSPEDQFKLIADRISAIPSPAVKAAAAMQLLGRSGTQLLPLMEDGAAGIDALMNQARALGLTMSTEDAKAAEALNDAFDTLWKVLKHGVFVIGSALAPTLQATSEWITRLIVSTTAWIKEHRDLVVMILKVAAALTLGGLAVMTLGYAIIGVGAVFKMMSLILTTAASAIGLVGSALAAMLSPVGLAITAVTALGAILIYASGAGGKAMAWLGERFAELSAFASATFGAIADSLMAGDIVLAARVLWLSLKVIWQKGASSLTAVWQALQVTSAKAASGLWYGVAAAFEIGVASVSQVMLKLYYGVMNVWQRLSTGVMNLWDGAVNWVAKRIVDLWGLIDDTLDTDAIKGQLDQQATQRIEARDQEKNQAVGKINADRDAALKELGQTHQQNMAAIGQGSIDTGNQLDAQAQAKIDAAQAELDAARAEWQAAIDQARQPAAPGEGGGRLMGRPDLGDYLEGLAPALETAQRSLSTAGTFSAFEAAGMGTTSNEERIAKATEETAQRLKRIERRSPYAPTLMFS